jgi:hypothetical protein
VTRKVTAPVGLFMGCRGEYGVQLCFPHGFRFLKRCGQRLRAAVKA